MADIDKLEWLLDIPEEKLEDFLDNDSKILYERLGVETLVKLQEHVPSLQFYISQRPIERARRYYIIEHFEGDNHKDLAAKLGCSEIFVRETVDKYREAQQSEDHVEPDLFAQQYSRKKTN